MKRCPECGRDYNDDSLSYCLDDGSELLFGPASADEPATAILHETARPGEAATRAQIHTTERTSVLPSGTADVPKTKGFDKRLLLAPLVLAAIVVGGFAAYRYLGSSGSGQINSIAVLPFQNRSGDTDTDYLSDGLADSLIYRLSQLPNLKVSPTSSVMRFKGKESDVAEVAKELDVDAVMSGRLMQRGDDLSISVQLVDARSNKLIWAEQYERKMADLLATQREITTAITEKLQLKLGGDETGIAKRYTNSNEAYQLYLKARYHYAKRTKDDLNKAIEYFQQAVALDPNFALAHAVLADLYISMPAYPYMSPNEALPKATAAAKRALEVDPLLPEAHAAAGYAHCFADQNFQEAERYFRRAIELDPRNSLTRVRYGIYFKVIGQPDAAVRETQTAVELEPLNLVNNANLTWMFMDARRFEDAVANGRKLHDLEPGFGLGNYQLGLAYSANGMHQDAIDLAERVLARDPQNQLMLQVAGYAYARSGRRDDAVSVIKRLKEIAKTQYVITYFIATIHAGLGDTDAAFAELQNAEREKDWRLTGHIKNDYMLDQLRGDARYKDLVKRLNLSE